MASERYIVCGGASATVPASLEQDAIRLHLYGPQDDDKLTLKIEDIREQMYKEVPARFHDLLEIATYVFAADQLVRRGAKDVETFGSNWRRNLHFVVPVSDVAFWRSDKVKQCLQVTLGFLSDDHYEFDFVPIVQRPSFQGFLNFNDKGAMLGFPEQVIMFSGGLDSLGGAVEEIVNQKRRVILVNHRPTPKLDKRYQAIREGLDAKAPNNPPCHIRVTVHKQKWFNKEYTQRTRSFLFVSLGATIANMLGKSNVRFYENGVISMNLPVCAQVVGGKATRTTHPRVLNGFQTLLSMIADHPFTVENPFLWKTKGEVVSLIAKSGCPELIGPSISCTHTWEMTKEHSHCGTCSQCVDRRFSIIAAGAEQHDPLDQYTVDVFTQSRQKNEKVHEDKTLFASYLERANQVDRFTGATQFLAKYGEVARALPYLNGDPGASSQRCYELYKRHSAEVAVVIQKMFALHGPAIFKRTLPADAMMRIVYESNLPTSVPALPVYQEQMPDNVFRRCGGAWQVRFKGQKAFTVLPWLGASYIHYLLVSPNEPRPCIDIVCSTAIDFCDQAINAKEAIDEGLQSASNPMLAGLGDISDWDAIKEYRAKARELLVDIENARRDNNNVLEQQYENDLAMITAKINEAVGIGGKLKQAKDKRKNIRDSFRNNVKRVIEKQIKDTDPALAAHLEKAILYGNTSRYMPEDGLAWETRPVKND
ncbi:MAG: 7-cyano-7-deazaguanine synthase [Verrucomicrobia bacterium]|nr:7-cyano-7-deazaguanine synthase [Verrucomicrobiota bacterium]